MSAPVVLLPADPKANYLAHQDEVDRAIHEVLAGGRYILGEQVAAFEQDFARYLGVRDAVGVGSGTDALHLALRACGIGPGDAVITVSHTAVATVAAIELAGATPVLVEIHPATFTLDPHSLADTLKRPALSQRSVGRDRLKAIIPVHLYGHPGDMPAIMRLARDYNLYVIEDCAQAHGANIQGRKTGTWGDVGAFSFYPTKNLGALGDGGALVTDNPVLAERARQLREYGWRDRYISDIPGMNTRLDELQAAILRVKLSYLDEENARRRELARIYDASLQATPLTIPQVCNNVCHVYHQYVVRSKQRDSLRSFLAAHGVGTLIHYPVPVHLQPAYHARVSLSGGGLHYTEQVCQEILSLPMHAQLRDEQVQHVSKLIENWYGEIDYER